MADEKKGGKARVIADHGEHRVDDIVEGAEAAAGIAGGWADGHADAVAHAEKLARRRARDEADAE